MLLLFMFYELIIYNLFPGYLQMKNAPYVLCNMLLFILILLFAPVYFKNLLISYIHNSRTVI